MSVCQQEYETLADAREAIGGYVDGYHHPVASDAASTRPQRLNLDDACSALQRSSLDPFAQAIRLRTGTPLSRSSEVG